MNSVRTIWGFLNNKRLFVLFLVFIFFLVSTFFAWKISKDVVGQERRQRFFIDTQNIKNLIEERFNSYIGFLYGIEGFLDRSETISKNEWSSYVTRTKIIERYPGLSSVAFVQRVKSEDKQDFIEDVRLDKTATSSGYTNFKIHPESQKKEYYVIKYIEPDAGKANAIGFDTSSDEKRLTALIRARDSGSIASTGRVVTASTGKSGFALNAPIYKKDAPPQTEKARQENLIGFVFLNFLLEDTASESVFRSIFGRTDLFPDIDFEIYDSKEETEDHLLYDHDLNQKISDIPEGKLTTAEDIKINGETWVLRTAVKPTFELTKSQEYLPKIILGSGLFFSFLILLVYIKTIRRSN